MKMMNSTIGVLVDTHTHSLSLSLSLCKQWDTELLIANMRMVAAIHLNLEIQT